MTRVYLPTFDDITSLVDDNDPRLTDARPPAPGSVVLNSLNPSLRGGGSAPAGAEAVRSLGHGATQALPGDEPLLPSTGQKNALAGSSGAPGTTNPFVTNTDARNTDARIPVAHTHPQSDVTGLPAALTGKLDTSQKGVPNGVAGLDSAGKVAAAALPAISLVNVFTVASQAAQLALTAQEGDVAIRSDLSQSFVHNSGTAGTMADWTPLASPSSAVLSVAGKNGIVTLVTADIAGLDTALTGKLSASDPSVTNARAPTAHKATHATGGTDALAPSDIGAQATSQKGAANGYAGLDSGGKVSTGQLPLRRRLVAGGSLGATPSLTMQSDDMDVWLTGVLSANATLTVTSLIAGQGVRLLFSQDATGGRTLAVTAAGGTGVSVPVPAAVTASFVVDCFYDGTDLYIKGPGS